MAACLRLITAFALETLCTLIGPSRSSRRIPENKVAHATKQLGTLSLTMMLKRLRVALSPLAFQNQLHGETGKIVRGLAVLSRISGGT